MNTPTRNHEPNLLVDIGAGVVLESPPNVVVTRRYCESHPFIEVARMPSGDNFVIAGPHAKRVAGGSGGTDYVLYRIDREVAGSLHLTREV